MQPLSSDIQGITPVGVKLVTNIFILNVYAAFKQRGTAK